MGYGNRYNQWYSCSGEVPTGPTSTWYDGWLPGHGSVQEVLDAAGVDPRARGEELSLEDFCAITRAATSAG